MGSMPDGDGMGRRDNEGLASSFFAKRDRKCNRKGEGGPLDAGACPSHCGCAPTQANQ